MLTAATGAPGAVFDFLLMHAGRNGYCETTSGALVRRKCDYEQRVSTPKV